MVLLSALCLSEKSSDLDEFCSSVGLRPKALTEINRLRKQLCSEIESVIPGVEQLFQPGLCTPNQEQCRLLRQLLLAGSADQIGRKIQQGEEGYQHGAYRVGAMQQPVFIHSSSVLKKRSPDWIIYQEVFETDKIYVRGITEVDPAWLPKFAPGLCNLGKPLEEPEPSYCSETGTVMAAFKGTFGSGAFILPTVVVEYPTSVEKFKYFAKFLLEGKVATQLTQFTSSLLSNPVIMTKSWSNLQPRTELLYKKLAQANVDNKLTLKTMWQTDKKFLLAEYSAWLPEVLGEDVKKVWPPAVS